VTSRTTTTNRHSPLPRAISQTQAFGPMEDLLFHRIDQVPGSLLRVACQPMARPTTRPQNRVGGRRSPAVSPRHASIWTQCTTAQDPDCDRAQSRRGTKGNRRRHQRAKDRSCCREKQVHAGCAHEIQTGCRGRGVVSASCQSILNLLGFSKVVVSMPWPFYQNHIAFLLSLGIEKCPSWAAGADPGHAAPGIPLVTLRAEVEAGKETGWELQDIRSARS
jgi:hypothetical protein